MKGVCTLVLDELIAIHDIKILMKPREEGLFFAMPSKKVFTGANEAMRFVDIVHPINKLTREKLEEIIFALYKIVESMANTYVTFENTNASSRGCWGNYVSVLYDKGDLWLVKRVVG